MRITEILSPEQIAMGAIVNSKKRVLEKLGELLARGADDLDAGDIFDCLLARERLGSTGLGKGVAIPHARMGGNQHILAAFIRLDQGIDFDATDQQSVDLFFALLVPGESTQTHLQLLAQLAGMFHDQELCTRLRKAKDSEILLKILREWEQASASTNANP